jgi:hypothetical protein
MANGYYIRYSLPALFYPSGPVNWLLVGTLNGKRLLYPSLDIIPSTLQQPVTISVTVFHCWSSTGYGEYASIHAPCGPGPSAEVSKCRHCNPPCPPPLCPSTRSIFVLWLLPILLFASGGQRVYSDDIRSPPTATRLAGCMHRQPPHYYAVTDSYRRRNDDFQSRPISGLFLHSSYWDNVTIGLTISFLAMLLSTLSQHVMTTFLAILHVYSPPPF